MIDLDFDGAGYEKRVLRPLRGRASALPPDLVERYDVDLAMRQLELVARVRAVREFWRSRAAAGGFVGNVCEALLVADGLLEAEHGAETLLSINWWRSLVAPPTAASRGSVEPLRAPARRVRPTPASPPPGYESPTDRAPVHPAPVHPAPVDPVDREPARAQVEAVVSMLAEGRLGAARRESAGLVGPVRDVVMELVRQKDEELTGLRTAASAHLASARSEDAAACLRRAVTIAVDLPEVASELMAIPAAPVGDVEVVAEGTGVRVSWTSAPVPGYADGPTFRIKCGGRELTSTSHSSVVDPAPPVGVPVTYTVTAVVPGRARSIGATGSIRIVPPVADVVLAPRSGAITADWSAHPAVIGVEVRRRPVGAKEGEVAVRASGIAGFRDPSADDGVEYRYELIACYPGADGGLLRAQPVVVVGATRPTPVPVEAVGARSVRTATGFRVELAWRQSVGAEIVVRRSGEACSTSYGRTVTDADLTGFGVEVTGDRGRREAMTTLVSAVGPGTFLFTAFTRSDDGWICGASTTVQFVEPVSRLEARRRGAEVVLAWVWPSDAGVAEITWSKGVVRITRPAYSSGGGFRLPEVRSAEVIEVRAVVLDVGGVERRSEPEQVQVEALRLPVTYTVSKVGSRLRRNEQAVVRVSSVHEIRGATVALVCAPGPIIPLTTEQGRELVRRTVDLVPGSDPVLIETPFPRDRRPFWLRLFLVDGPDSLRLVDPPITQLKVT